MVGREIDNPAVDPVPVRPRRPKPSPNVVLAPVERSPRETPISPVITNRFRPAPPEREQQAFDPVSHFGLADTATIGETTKRGQNVPVIVGYTKWPEGHQNERYNGTLHIAGLGQSTIHLSFDALAGLLEATPKLAAYLEQHAGAIAAAEASGLAARRKKPIASGSDSA